MILRANMLFTPAEADMPIQEIRIKVANQPYVEKMILADKGYILNMEFADNKELGEFRHKITTMMNNNSSIILPSYY